MIIKRRGRKTALSYVGKSLHSVRVDENIPHSQEAKLLLMLQKLIRPTAKPQKNSLYYQKLYENLTESQQKNLIDKIANQILFAHRSIVAQIFSNLRAFSVDFSQQTEVVYRKQLLKGNA